MAELQEYSSRVIHTLFLSHGETVVSGAANDTVQFYKVFSVQIAGDRRRKSLLHSAALEHDLRHVCARD